MAWSTPWSISLAKTAPRFSEKIQRYFLAGRTQLSRLGEMRVLSSLPTNPARPPSPGGEKSITPVGARLRERTSWPVSARELSCATQGARPQETGTTGRHFPKKWRQVSKSYRPRGAMRLSAPRSRLVTRWAPRGPDIFKIAQRRNGPTIRVDRSRLRLLAGARQRRGGDEGKR